MKQTFDTTKGKVEMDVQISWPKSMNGLGVSLEFEYKILNTLFSNYDPNLKKRRFDYPDELHTPENIVVLLRIATNSILSEINEEVVEPSLNTMLAQEGWSI